MKEIASLLLLFFALAGIGCARRVAEFEIPEGYVGWVVVHYEAPDCPVSNRRSWWSVVPVGLDGSACSQNWSGHGLHFVTYYFVDKNGRRVREIKSTGWGKGGEIWGGAGSVDPEKRKTFFVGTEKEFKETKTGPPR